MDFHGRVGFRIYESYENHKITIISINHVHKLHTHENDEKESVLYQYVNNKYPALELRRYLDADKYA